MEKKEQKKKLETKKRFLFKGFVISGLRYDSKGWTISLMINRRLETWFSRKQLRITWAEHVSNEKVLKEWEKKGHLYLCIKMRQKSCLENLRLTGII